MQADPGSARSGPTAASARYTALDGLRGFAAVTVVVYHSFLTIPALAGSFELPVHRATGLAWVLTYTPVHLFWAGGEAVYLFFVLSGFVLVLPVVRAQSFSWRAYYPRRLARLYLPIWGAIAIATGLVFAVPRHVVSGASWWVNGHHQSTTAQSVLVDALSIFGTDKVNSALWSLQYELFFSLTVPVYVVVCMRVLPKRLLLVKLVGTVIVAVIGQALQHKSLTIAAIFLLGALLATHGDQLSRWTERLNGRGAAVAAVLAGLGIIAPWLVAAPGEPSATVGDIATGFQYAATTVIVILFLAWRPAISAATSPLGRWLGTRSFSLYLIHEPIVVSTALLLGPAHTAWTPLISIPIALIAAAAFYRLVEGPSHRLSQRIGRHFTPAPRTEPVPR